MVATCIHYSMCALLFFKQHAHQFTLNASCNNIARYILYFRINSSSNRSKFFICARTIVIKVIHNAVSGVLCTSSCVSASCHKSIQYILIIECKPYLLKGSLHHVVCLSNNKKASILLYLFISYVA